MPAVFDFPYHRVGTKYPTQGNNLKLGGSWDYSSKPNCPPQRVFTLDFKVLKYYGEAGSLDLISDKEINLGVLEAFYNEHQLYKKFIYPHPVYGELLVKFQRPLEVPMGIAGGGGAIGGVVVVLVEQPSPTLIEPVIP